MTRTVSPLVEENTEDESKDQCVLISGDEHGMDECKEKTAERPAKRQTS